MKHHGSKQRSLVLLIAQLSTYSIDQLVPIVRDRSHPTLLRVAALRWIVGLAPLSVTQGAPYGWRRRYVRRHYRV